MGQGLDQEHQWPRTGMVAGDLEAAPLQHCLGSPELSLNGLLGPWVGMEAPGKDAHGH